MKSKFRVGQVVKYSNPQKGEEDLRFYVNEIHEAENSLKEKLHVELICNQEIKPTFCHFSDEYEPSYFKKTVEYNGIMVECENFGKL
jgi:hypothetical protein